MSEPKYVSVESVARRLGVPVAFLRKEIDAGRIPFMRAGRRIVVSLEAVEAALITRAQRGESEAAR